MMVGDFLLGDIVGIEYNFEVLGIAVQIGDIDGDFIGSLNDAESELCRQMLGEFVNSFVHCILIIRQGKESQDELEG